MADYKAARAKTDRNEGGCSFNPNDKGNIVVKGVVTIPTYKGIAPVFWKNWRGFAIITVTIKDTMVNMPKYGTTEHRTWCSHLNKKLADNPTLQKYVDEFYETNFWHANRLGEIINQDVAEWLYDHAVNGGARGIMWAQMAAKVKPDGSMGPLSVKAINAMDPADFLSRVEDIAGAYRLDKAHDDPSQIQFLGSWLSRDGQPPEIIAMVKAAARDGKLDDAEVESLKTAMAATA